MLRTCTHIKYGYFNSMVESYTFVHVHVETEKKYIFRTTTVQVFFVIVLYLCVLLVKHKFCTLYLLCMSYFQYEISFYKTNCHSAVFRSCFILKPIANATCSTNTYKSSAFILNYM